MSVSPLDFHAAAQGMCGEGNEIGYRNASSRAYYAAYHLGLSVIDSLPSVPVNNDIGVHEKLIQRLTKIPNSFAHAMVAKSAGYLLAQMRKSRVKADYDINEGFSDQEAKSQLEVFSKYFQKMETFAKS